MGQKLRNLSDARNYVKGFKKPFTVLYVTADGKIYDSKFLAEKYCKTNEIELFIVKKKKDGGTK